MRFVLAIPLPLLAAALTGCIQAKGIQFETTSRPGKPADYPVEIVDSSALQGRGFKVIGQVQAKSHVWYGADNTVNVLKSKARALGGDALLDLTSSPVPEDEHAFDMWRAKVIVWIEARE